MKNLQVKGLFGADLVIPVVLSVSDTVPWTYSTPGTVVLDAVDKDANYSAIGTFAITSVNSDGLHLIVVPTGNIVVGTMAFTISSSTDAFEPVMVVAEITSIDIDAAYLALTSQLGAFITTTNASLASLQAELEALLLQVEGNVEKTFVWNVDRTAVESITSKFVSDDAAANFATPDRQVNTVFTRGTDDRVNVITTREVQL